MANIGMVFQAPMVLAFLSGRKSQTRRPLSASRCLVDGHVISAKRWAAMDFDWDAAMIDPGPSPAGNAGPYLKAPSRAHGTTHRIYPRAQVGDRMWVREALAPIYGDPRTAIYRADGERQPGSCCGCAWKPSIHMPRWAALIERGIVGLRFQRMQDISEADATAEGIQFLNGRFTFNDGLHESRSAKESFRALWESIHGTGSWDANPMLLVYEFAETPRR